MPRTMLTDGERLACYLTRTLGLSHTIGRVIWTQLSDEWRNQCRLEQFERTVRRIASERSLIDPVADGNGAGVQYYAEIRSFKDFCQLVFWERRFDVNALMVDLLVSHALSVQQWSVENLFGGIPDYITYTGSEANDWGVHGQKGESLLEDATRTADLLHLLNELSKLLHREGWVQRGARMKSTGAPHFKWDGDRVRFKSEGYRTLTFVDLYSDDPDRDRICLLKLVKVRDRLRNEYFIIHCSYSQPAENQNAPPQDHHDVGALPSHTDIFKFIEFLIVELGPHKQRNRLHSLKRTLDKFLESTPDIVWIKKQAAALTIPDVATE